MNKEEMEEEEKKEELKIGVSDLQRDEVIKWIQKFGAYGEMTKDEFENIKIIEFGNEPIILNTISKTMALIIRGKGKKGQDISLSLDFVLEAFKILGKGAVLKVYKDKPAVIENEQGDICIVVAPRMDE